MIRLFRGGRAKLFVVIAGIVIVAGSFLGYTYFTNSNALNEQALRAAENKNNKTSSGNGSAANTAETQKKQEKEAPKPTVSVAPVPAAPGPGAAPGAAGGAVLGWPDETNTGVAGCPPLERVNNGDQVNLNQNGQVLENKEYLNNVVINIAANNVTVRCVKLNGAGYFGVDNTNAPNATGAVVDRVEVDCQDSGTSIAFLLHDAVLSRANAYRCNDMVMVGGDNLTIQDSFCHDLSSYDPGFHADCIQNLGGNTGLTIRHNSLWGWDTSDVLLGQEYGDAQNVLIENNRFMSDPDITPPPAYLLYLSGTNTIVRNNFFTKRYTYGPCTLNTDNPYTWVNNRWWEDNTIIPDC